MKLHPTYSKFKGVFEFATDIHACSLYLSTANLGLKVFPHWQVADWKASYCAEKDRVKFNRSTHDTV